VKKISTTISKSKATITWYNNKVVIQENNTRIKRRVNKVIIHPIILSKAMDHL